MPRNPATRNSVAAPDLLNRRVEDEAGNKEHCNSGGCDGTIDCGGDGTTALREALLKKITFFADFYLHIICTFLLSSFL